MSEIFGEGMKYYWTLWQSEMARDYIFKDPQSLSSFNGKPLTSCDNYRHIRQGIEIHGASCKERWATTPTGKSGAFDQGYTWTMV